MKIIVGLGNPGEKYQKTRHNIGFMFLDFLKNSLGLEAPWHLNKKFKAFIVEERGVILIKPWTYMNDSGLALRSFLDYHQLLTKKMGLFLKKDLDLSSNLLLVHDDLDLDFSKFKLSLNISSAGHNGVNSVIKNLKTKNFNRLRFGINNEFKNRISGEKFVLQNFSSQEKEALEGLFLAAQASLREKINFI